MTIFNEADPNGVNQRVCAAAAASGFWAASAEDKVFERFIRQIVREELVRLLRMTAPRQALLMASRVNDSPLDVQTPEAGAPQSARSAD